MTYQLIGSGGIVDIDELSQYESGIAEGERAVMEIDLRLPVSQSLAAELESRLRQAGVDEVHVTTASPLIRVYFRKGFPWLAVIAATILAMIVLAVLVVGWRLFREVVPESLQPIVGTGMIVVGVLLGAAFLLRRRI